MKELRKHLEKIRKLKKHKYHHLIHKVHTKHNISKKTLFYIKEYGPHTNVPRTIVRESLKILILTSLISSFGGLALEHIKVVFLAIIPLVILLPALNDMIGDYGTIIASRFSTLLHENKIEKRWWKDTDVKVLSIQIFITSTITAFLSAAAALIASLFSTYSLNSLIAIKVFLITIVDTIILVAIMLFTAIVAGLYFYRKKEDPNNFLIPITTSIADFSNMAILSILVILFF